MVAFNPNPSPAELRRWGLGMVIGATVGGLVLLLVLNQVVLARLLWGFGLLSFVASRVGARPARPLYLGWMAFAWAISSALAMTALTLVFVGVVTPIGLMARLAGRDRLKLRAQPAAASFWESPPPAATERRERQF